MISLLGETMAIAKDRTGEVCPKCHKGKLEKKGGGRMVRGPDSQQPNISDFTEFECDKCHEIFGSVGFAPKTSTVNIKTSPTFKNS